MTEMNKLTKVEIIDVNDNDKLLFKLIFSIAEKTSGRPYKYSIVEKENDSPDILITASRDRIHLNSNIPAVLLKDRGIPAEDYEYLVERPLIATRVLVVLDQAMTSSLQHKESSKIDVKPSIILDDMDDSIDFCITEEEASELAIVDDEMLANPANKNIESGSPQRTDIQNQVNNISTLVKFNREPNEKCGKSEINTELSTIKPRAIVVDDSASVRKQIELELDLFDVEVDYAESVEQTYRLLEKHSYDIAFLDVVLPDGDGFQVCKTIKQSVSNINVIMLTGKATAADKIKGTMVGCDAYLVKPVGRMTFQNTVCTYLKLKESHEAINA
jgi:CheY-like chemotaxis protein